MRVLDQRVDHLWDRPYDRGLTELVFERTDQKGLVVSAGFLSDAIADANETQRVLASHVIPTLFKVTLALFEVETLLVLRSTVHELRQVNVHPTHGVDHVDEYLHVHDAVMVHIQVKIAGNGFCQGTRAVARTFVIIHVGAAKEIRLVQLTRRQLVALRVKHVG